MSSTYAGTNDTDLPGLTVEILLRLKEELTPILYYRMSEYVPKADSDGEPLIVSAPTIGLDLRELPDERVVYFHPDNLPALAQAAEKSGYRLVPRG